MELRHLFSSGVSKLTKSIPFFLHSILAFAQESYQKFDLIFIVNYLQIIINLVSGQSVVRFNCRGLES